MWTRIGAIFKREFAAYLNSLVAYFFMVIFLAAVNMVYAFYYLFRHQVALMTSYFDFAVIGLWIFIPAITMRVWAEEKKSGTLELLMTMPLRDGEAVVGKFLASLSFLALTLLLSFLSIPTLLAYLSDVDWGPIIGGYLGLLLLGASFIAVGLAVSSMTENQFIAFLITVMICLGLLGISELSETSWAVLLLIYFIINPIVYVVVRLLLVGQSGTQFWAMLITNIICTIIVGVGEAIHLIYKKINPPVWLSRLETYLDAGHHFNSISRGVIDLRDVIYYLSVIVFFLFLNYRALASRRWE